MKNEINDKARQSKRPLPLHTPRIDSLRIADKSFLLIVNDNYFSKYLIKA